MNEERINDVTLNLYVTYFCKFYFIEDLDLFYFEVFVIYLIFIFVISDEFNQYFEKIMFLDEKY